MRTLKLACCAIVVVACLVAAAAAQAPVPTVAVSAGGSAVTIQPSGPIPAGPTRFAFSRSGRGDVEGVIATLRAGVSVDELRATLSRSPDAALALVFLEAGVSLSDATPNRAVTVTLRPNVTYVAISIRGRSIAIAELATTGAANGAATPPAGATVRMVDYGFRGAATLPRNGSIRVANQGAALHFALAFPLRPAARARQVRAAFRGGSERAFGRIVGGAPVMVQNLISPGSVNTNPVRFQRRGRYALVCFFGEHNRLGMYRVVRVR